MKKILLLFAAMCSTMMMHAEIVHHAACEPTYPTVGYAQECWENTETGKLYSEAKCTNELNPAYVVTYKKLKSNPASGDGDLQESAEYAGCPFNWAKYIFINDWDQSRHTCEFKVHGYEVDNARLKFYFSASTNKITLDIFVNGNSVFQIPAFKWSGVTPITLVSLPNLKTGDVVRFEVEKGETLATSDHGNCFAACLEYTSINGGNPNSVVIYTDDKRKFKGTDDPELTYIVTPSSLAEKVSGINLSRDPGEELGFYTIHASQAEGANPDYEILFSNSSKLEIVDGVHNEKGETRSDGLEYLQDCWEEKATGKYYADDYLEHELTSDEAIGYPKLPSNPITAKDGFTIKESSIYDGIPFDWAAETTFEKGESGMRTVEITVTEPNMYNNARLVWYISTGAGYAAGHLDYAIYKNGVVVESYSQPLNAYFTRGLRFVPLPDLKIGDKIKFEFNWRDGSNIPIVAACLQYIYPQDLYLRAEEAGSTIQLNKVGNPYDTSLEYSTTGTKWQPYTFGQTITLANEGDRVYFRKADEGVASGFSKSLFNYYQFAMTGKIAASGNVMSLIDNTCKATTIPNTFCFTNLFYNCQSLTQAPKLPALTLASDCYNRMFENCTKLATAPVLPAKTLKTYCYYFMFRKCTSLTAAPELPATTLAEGCYGYMFDGCTGLTSAPVLSATTMANYCYHVMFKDCTNLTTASALPATTLASNCYREMFSGCTKLESAPALPATTIAYSCYEKMFSGCSSLTTAPELPATTLEAYSYNSMFEGCTSLTTAPELPATSLQFRCYNNMFNGCTNLNHVKVAFTEWTDNTTVDWLNGVASTGIFVCPDALDKTQTGASYIPEGWTPVFEAKANKDPESENYYSTFYSGTNAYEVPEGVTAYTGAVEESTSNPDESVLKLTAISDGIIPADEPVILKAAQSQVYLPYTTETASKNEDNELVGTDEAKTLGTNDYALSLGQHGVGFYLWNGKTIGANKAYLTLDEALGVKALQFRFDDEPGTTGINFVNENENENENLYNLNGLRVGKDYKGIVIKNGKKALMK